MRFQLLTGDTEVIDALVFHFLRFRPAGQAGIDAMDEGPISSDQKKTKLPVLFNQTRKYLNKVPILGLTMGSFSIFTEVSERYHRGATRSSPRFTIKPRTQGHCSRDSEGAACWPWERRSHPRE